MEQREKLIELLDQNYGYVEEQLAENLADHLLANGVVVLPCRCGDCEHWSRNTGHCWITQDVMLNTDFCSYGERKGGD